MGSIREFERLRDNMSIIKLTQAMSNYKGSLTGLATRKGA
jgi:hypothetical protein